MERTIDGRWWLDEETRDRLHRERDRRTARARERRDELRASYVVCCEDAASADAAHYEDVLAAAADAGVQIRG